MNQREIKIPISCSNFARTIGVLFLSVYFLFVIPRMGYNLEHDVLLIVVPFLFWGLIEILSYITDKFIDEEPLLPFTFKCKCDKKEII